MTSMIGRDLQAEYRPAGETDPYKGSGLAMPQDRFSVWQRKT